MTKDTVDTVRRDLNSATADAKRRLDAIEKAIADFASATVLLGKRADGTDASIDEMKRNITSIIARGKLPEVVVEEPPTPPPPPANTSLPTISTAREAVQCIVTSVGVWTGSPTNYYYQWRKDGADIVGATSSAYTPSSGDAGHSLACAVTAINASGSTTAVSAAATVAAAVPPSPPVNTVLPTIDTATEGVACTVTSNGTWSNSPTAYSYQWRVNSTPILGATSSSYTPLTADVGKLLDCVVTATSAFGSGSATSASATVIAAAVVGTSYSFDFASGATGWTQFATPAPGYAYTLTTVVTGVVSGRARVVAASGKDYPTLSIRMTGLTAGQQYTATIAFANRTGIFDIMVMSDPTAGSRTALNWTQETSASSGNVVLTFTSAGTDTYLRLRVYAEGGGGESVDIATVSVVPSAVTSTMSAGWWRSASQPIILLAEFLAEHTQVSYPGNPRGLLPNTIGNAFNATALRSALLDRADLVGAAANSAGAQGVLIWDLPGQEFGHVTTYLGAPDELAAWAPELEATVGGVAIVDEYITRLKSYGIRVGTTLRPQHVRYGTSLPALPDAAYPIGSIFLLTNATPPHRAWTVYQDATFPLAWYDWSLGGGSGNQTGPGQEPIRTTADRDAAKARIIARIAYCKARWGMSMFYIDSTTWEYGQSLEAAGFWDDIQAAHPDVLLMPENEDLGYGNYTVPYGEYRFGDVGLGLNATDPNAMFALNFSSMPVAYWIEPFITYVKDQYKARRLIFIRHWGEADQQAHIDQIVAG